MDANLLPQFEGLANLKRHHVPSFYSNVYTERKHVNYCTNNLRTICYMVQHASSATTTETLRFYM